MSTVAASRPPREHAAPWWRRERTLGIAAAVAAALMVLWQGNVAGAGSLIDLLPEVLRAGLAAAVLFGLCGYAPARLLLPRSLRPHLWLFVPAVGAITSALALTVLGFLRVPFAVSLPLVLVTGAVAAVLLRVRSGPAEVDSAELERAGGRAWRIWWPLYIALLVGTLALLPMFRGGEATVIGQNPDAALAAGSAELLQHEPPRATAPELPVDKMPAVWRSKYPIIYVLSGVSSLSGLEPWQAFATLSAVLLAVTGAGFMLFAYHALGAGRLAALLAMAFVPLDRVAFYLSVHPYYNQLWGLLVLPFILLFGLRFLRRPDRQSGALFVLFSAIGTFAYPLMMFFPLVALGVCALMVWRRRRAEGKGPGWVAGLKLPRGRRALALGIPLGAVATPFLLILLAGVLEKVRDLGKVWLPGSDLSEWQGDVRSYPFVRFFGLIGPTGLMVLAVIGLFAAAIYALRRTEREIRLPLYATGAAALFFAAYYDERHFGAYLYFKDVAFLGPLVVAIAVVGLVELARRSAGRRGRVLAAGAIAALALVFTINVKDEIGQTFDQLRPTIVELRDWGRDLPKDASIRIDVAPGGHQIWAFYFLHEHPVSALDPLRDAGYPSPPFSRRADYVLAENASPRPLGAIGSPLRRNQQFSLYRLRGDLPGPDRSSLTLVQPKFRSALE